MVPSKPSDHQDETYAILPHTPRTQMQLRGAGIEAPAPILFHYDWASGDGAVPFQVQKQHGFVGDIVISGHTS